MKIQYYLLSLLLFIPACAGKEKPASEPKTLVVAYRSLLQSLDPISENSIISNSIFSNIYDSLLKRDKQMRLVPSLAQNWVNPEDELTWVLELRKDAFFHDGTPVLAEDVIFSIRRAQSPESVFAPLLAVIARVQALDEHRIRIVTKNPYPVLLNRLADVWIVSRKAFSKGFRSDQIPVGSGPYQVLEWEKGSSLLLTAFDRYREGKPAVERIRIIALPSVQERISRLIRQEVQLLPGLEPPAFESLASQKEVKLYSTPGLMVLYIGMDVGRPQTPYAGAKRNPFLDIRVRQAVAHAIDINKITNEILKGHAIAATQLLAPTIHGFNSSIQRLPYDPAAAMALLKEAGFAKGFTVRFDFTNNRYRNDVEIGKSIAADLEKVGIQVKLNPVKREDLFDLRMKKDTSFFMTGWGVGSGDASGALDFVVHSQDHSRGYGTENSVGYANPEVDRLIGESAENMDTKDRAKSLEKAMDVAMRDCVFIPLHVENSVAAASTRINFVEEPGEFLLLTALRWSEN